MWDLLVNYYVERKRQFHIHIGTKSRLLKQNINRFIKMKLVSANKQKKNEKRH